MSEKILDLKLNTVDQTYYVLSKEIDIITRKVMKKLIEDVKTSKVSLEYSITITAQEIE